MNAPKKTLQGKIALVAGATRGAGRGIAVALGESGATVYCTGRSSRKALKKRPRAQAPTPGRPETIEETAELVTAAGGHGIAIRIDHTEPAEVRKLVATIERRHKHLDILVNDIWGGDELVSWGAPFWNEDMAVVRTLIERALALDPYNPKWRDAEQRVRALAVPQAMPVAI